MGGHIGLLFVGVAALCGREGSRQAAAQQNIGAAADRDGCACFRYHPRQCNGMQKRSGTVDHQVSVVLKTGERYDFPLAAEDMAAFNPASARHWIAEAFQAAGLETPNPMGKLLIIDEILLLAENFKPADYKPATEDVRRFLCAALTAMGRPSLTIDLVAYKL
jgi:hypothetical protein